MTDDTKRTGRARSIATAMLLALLAGAAPMVAGAAEPADDVAVAAARYERGEWAAVLEPLERAADAGDARAQEMAGFMRWLGPALYGPALLRDRNAALRWFERAATGGSEVGRLMAARIRATRRSAGEPAADAKGVAKDASAD